MEYEEKLPLGLTGLRQRTPEREFRPAELPAGCANHAVCFDFVKRFFTFISVNYG
jgi:hypothetical protein